MLSRLMSRQTAQKTLLLLLILIWIAIFTTLAFNFHAAMRTNRSDLGQIDQAVWNSSQGRFLENTDAGFLATRLTDHVEPILVLISPIFWLWNDVRALLLLQVVAVAAGAWFVLRIAYCVLICHEPRQNPYSAFRIPHSYLPFAFTIAYLLAPQLQHAVLTEFHAAPLAVPLILWALWAVEKRRTWHFVIAAVLVALVKEEMAIAAAGLGVWALYRNTKYEIRNTKNQSPRTRSANSGQAPHSAPVRQAQGKFRIPHSALRTLSPYLLVSLSALIWFVVATFVIVPANAPLVYDQAQSVYFERFGPLGDSPISIVRTLLTDPATVWSVLREPARLNYLWGLLAPFGFLSLLAPELLIVALPLIVANLFSTYPGQYYNEFHYSAPIVPYVAVSAVIGARRLLALFQRMMGWKGGKEQREQRSNNPAHYAPRTTHLFLVSLSPFLLVWLFGWSVGEYITQGRGPLGGRYDPIVVTVHDRLLDRFVAQIPADAAVAATSAVQPHVSHRRYVYQLPLGLDAPVPADWLLIDVTSKTEMAPGDLKSTVDQLLASDWGVVDGADGFLLLHKGGTDKTIPDAFYDFVRTPAGSVTGAIAVDVDDWARWRETAVIFDAPKESALAGFRILSPDGEEIYNNGVLPTPAQLWYTPNLWQPNELIRLTTLALYLPRVWGVVSSDELVASYARTDGKRLIRLSAELVHSRNFGDELTQQTGWRLRSNSATLRLPTETIQLQGWLRERSSWAGEKLDLWLQWQGKSWPSGWTVFIHLRKDDGNAAQADDTPRWFIPVDAGEIMSEFGQVNDWRQLKIPDESQLGESYIVVVGLYESSTGQRAELVDGSGATIGNEFIVGTVTIGEAPVADQTCAMIPQSCLAQQ